MNIKIAILSFACLLIFGCSDSSNGSFTDKRDGKVYKTVKIGKQIWMAENLNYGVKESKCYEDKAENCDIYGRLYYWKTAIKACPEGWHLPDNKEWDELYHYADGTSGKSESPYESKSAGKYLKATSGWSDYEGKSGNGEDKYGFAALPGGYCSSPYFCSSSSYGAGINANWWSATQNYAYAAYARGMDCYSENAWWVGKTEAHHLFSVRCVKD